MRTLLRRSFFIKTEPTPNPNALIFRPEQPSQPLLAPSSAGRTFEFTTRLQAARASPLADELFKIDGVAAVLIGRDFLTVTRATDAPQWPQLSPQVYAAIMNFAQSGCPAVTETQAAPAASAAAASSDVEQMVREVLDTRIRPTVQEDGGDVELVGFDAGTGFVQLRLVGACRSCASSTVTLRNGIESMLMHYVPEVRGVEQVDDLGMGQC